MRIATLTQAQLDSLRPSLDTINTQLARRGNAPDRKVSRRRDGSPAREFKQLPQVYSKDAHGWTIPTAVYPQTTGRLVVVMEDEAWSRLNPASRALFSDLAVVGYPKGFQYGEA